MEKKTLEHLATLARLRIQEDEYVELETQIGAIVSFVDQVSSLSVEQKTQSVGAVSNVARLDESVLYPDASGLVQASTNNDGSFIKVPKIL